MTRRLFGGVTPKKFVIDVCGSLTARARQRAIASAKGEENPAFNECPCGTVVKEALRHIVDEEPVALYDEAVARALSRGPNIFTALGEEEVQRAATRFSRPRRTVRRRRARHALQRSLGGVSTRSGGRFGVTLLRKSTHRR